MVKYRGWGDDLQSVSNKLWLHVLPPRLKKLVEETADAMSPDLEEIRFRIQKPVIIKRAGKERFLLRDREPVCAQAADLEAVMDLSMRGSLYAFEEELKNGFVTLPGGHRLGFCGRAVLDQGRLRGLKQIRFLNLRVAKQVFGCGDALIPRITANRRWLSTLVASPPRWGKTTLIRELVRKASEGDPARYLAGADVSLVDERSEIAGSYLGEPQFELGPRTDVLDGCPKSEGMMMVVRSMAPDIVAADEIGGERDMEALRHVLLCGAKILTTVHGSALEELLARPGLGDFIRQGAFDRIVVLRGPWYSGLPPAVYQGKSLGLAAAEPV
ncbi:MAG: stage III sporulation protein AA [Peptococcaceae bacterium]|nr:stage III sporulation protein AA [Peptococcaceae bacterium]